MTSSIDNILSEDVLRDLVTLMNCELLNLSIIKKIVSEILLSDLHLGMAFSSHLVLVLNVQISSHVRMVLHVAIDNESGKCIVLLLVHLILDH